MRPSVTRRRAVSDPGRRPRRPALAMAVAALAGCLSFTVLAAGPAGARPAAAPPSRAAAATVRHHYAADHMGSGLARLAAATGASGSGAAVPTSGGVLGMDVSGYQRNVDWAAAWAAGGRFAVVKATEGTTYTNAYFAQQYDGSAAVGMIRGAYHFGLPNAQAGSAVAQADFFVGHGGGWSADGITLPPALDIEYNPYGPTCYRLSPASMVAWIQAFVTEVHARTGQYPLIYSTYGWWSRCTGNSSAFSQDPLWIADYGTGPGLLPAGWEFQTLWQYADSGAFPGDQDSFNGTPVRLAALAGRPGSSPGPIGDTVSAVLPAHVTVGGTTTAIPVTVTTSEPQAEVTVALRAVATGRISATATLTAPTPTTIFSGTVVLATADIGGWGAQTWVVTTPDPAAAAKVGAVLRAQSLLGMRATRSGATITVVGSARAYDTALGRSIGWTRRLVTLQRWTKTGWQRFAQARTDGHGNIALAVHIPFTVGLRLVDPSAPNTWGAASASQIL